MLIHTHTQQNIFSNFYHQNQKGTSNKCCPRNIFIPMILILYHKQKGTNNKFCPNMNSENSKTSEQNVLVLKLNDKIDLRIGKKAIALSNLSIFYT